MKQIGRNLPLLLAFAIVWFLAVLVGYVIFLVVGGWDRDENLALAEVLIPIGGAGFAVFAVAAAIRSFQPLRPEISILPVREIEDGLFQVSVVNEGDVAANDVTLRAWVAQLVDPTVEIEIELDRSMRLVDWSNYAAAKGQIDLRRERALPAEEGPEVVCLVRPSPRGVTWSWELSAGNARRVRRGGVL